MSDVSVIATVLNEAGDIERLVQSLMEQTLAPAEVIIVDGGSSDGTWEKLQAAKAKYPRLIAIRDETCRLPNSPGPISRGRNVAIAAATSSVIACVDAGCVYHSDWLERLTDPILRGDAEYALGGSCLDPEQSTVWDVASAPFFGVTLSEDAATKSCTARSMAFRKELWQRVGGFPEDILLGEDTVFDLKVRAIVAPAFAESAKAFYRPQNTLRTALRQQARYATSDGVAGVRPARLLRNLARCVVQIIAVVIVFRTWIPLACVLAFEVYTAFRLDWRDLRGVSVRTLGARMLYSLLVPWVVAWNQIKGAITKVNLPNRQNLG
jgi:hypothetical protein